MDDEYDEFGNFIGSVAAGNNHPETENVTVEQVEDDESWLENLRAREDVMDTDGQLDGITHIFLLNHSFH